MPGFESGHARSMSINSVTVYYLEAIIFENSGGTVTFKNPTSSNSSVVTASLENGAALKINKVLTGSSVITVDYIDSKGVTGMYVINVDN